MEYVVVLVAAVLANVLGALWYGPLFGKRWMTLAGLKEKDMRAAKKEGMAWRYVSYLIANIVMASSLAVLIAWTGASGARGGIEIAVWVWLGFIATISLGGVLWERKPWALWALNNGYNLLALLLMGAIIGAF